MSEIVEMVISGEGTDDTTASCDVEFVECLFDLGCRPWLSCMSTLELAFVEEPDGCCSGWQGQSLKCVHYRKHSLFD